MDMHPAKSRHHMQWLATGHHIQLAPDWSLMRKEQRDHGYPKIA